LSLQSIPILDISGFSTQCDKASRAIARDVDRACREIGFLVIAGHGIEAKIIENLDEAGRRFFDLPDSVKLKYAGKEGSYYGYNPIESSSLAYSLDNQEAKPDLREAFASCRPDIETGDAFFRSEAVKGLGYDIDFPTEIKAFRQIWTTYYDAMAGLGARIMRIFAVALELPIDFFDPMLSHHASNLALFNYPEQVKQPESGQIRGGAHTDFGSLTIVHADWAAPGGLQVQTKAKKWMDVEAPADAFVINIGDMMARWTNERWTSTLHRVANPATSSNRSTRRQSAVFFHTPNQDALVACLPSCRDADNSAKYTPITVGEHFLMKMGKMYEEAQ